jgi:hypothetical protein
MNRLSSQIENHEFIKELSHDQIPTIEKLEEGKGSKRGQMVPSSYTLSELEQYSKSLFIWSMRIRDCFETLEHAEVYLGSFRTNKRYKEAGIGRSHYINYHYFNYAITVTKVRDIALILTDKTFRLGNPERLCRLENIIENSWVRSTSVDESLKKLNSIVERWREPRNLFIHRGKTLKRESMYMLEAFEFLLREDPAIKFISPSDVKLLYKSELLKVYKELEETEQPLFKSTSELLSQLLPIYRFWRRILQEQTFSG